MSTIIQPFRFGGAPPPITPSAMDISSVVGRSYSLSESNRLVTDLTASTVTNGYIRSIVGFATGKHRVEVTSVSNSDGAMPGTGIGEATGLGEYLGSNDQGMAFFNTDQIAYNGGVISSGMGMVHGVGGQMAIEIDMDARLVRWKENTTGNQVLLGIPSGWAMAYFYLSTRNSGAQQRVNFGNAAWAITPTAGFEEGWGV